MHPAPQFVQIQMTNVLPASTVRTDQQTTGTDVAQTWQQACQQAFTGTGRTHQSNDFTGLQSQRAITQNLSPATGSADTDVI
ncbi:hypothetical protein D3C73_1610220 [compost metagenome]